MHWGTAAVDLALPAGIPVAVLIPSVVDILGVRHPDNEASLYRLSLPGAAGLDPSMTLAQHGIDDGSVLLLTRCRARLPAPRPFEVAQAVSATLDAATGPRSGLHTRAVRLLGVAAAIVTAVTGALGIVRNAVSLGHTRDAAATVAALAAAGAVALGLAALAHRTHHDQTAALALSLIATVFAGVAGFAAVPGAPGMPNVLLAAVVAGVTAVIAMRVSICAVTTLTAVVVCLTIVAVASLVDLVTAAPLRAIASAAALLSVGLLAVAARAAIALAGLSPRPGTPEVEPAEASTRAVRADRWLTSLLAGLSASATLGAVVAVLAGAPHPSCVAFGTLTGALLLLRSRSTDTRRKLVFAASGIVVAATTFGVAVTRAPLPGPWVAMATILAVAVAMCLAFAGLPRPASPVLRRGAGLLEFSALAGMVPLTCWICGLYAAARGWHLS